MKKSNFEIVMSDGCRISCDVKGNGQPIVFVHGWSANCKFFSQQVEHLSKNFMVVTYDLRGHGNSDKRMSILEKNLTIERLALDLKEIIEALNLDSVHLCGWSMGVSILLSYVEQFGHKYTKSLTLIDMTPKLVNDDSWNLGDFDAEENLKFTQSLAVDWKNVSDEMVESLFARSIDKNSSKYLWVKDQAAGNIPFVMVTLWISMALGDYRDVLHKISVPTYLPYSNGGDMYNENHGKYMHRNIKNSKLSIYENCGHSLFLEEPDRFNSEYENFILSI